MVVSPGKAAEVLKSVFLKAQTGVPVAKSAPVVIAERVVDGIAVIAIMFVTLLLAGDQLELGEYRALSQTIIFSSAALITAGLIVIQIAPLAYFCLSLLKKLPVVNRLYDPLLEFYESSRDVFKLRHVMPMSIVGLGVYGSSAIGFVLILMGFGLEFSWQLFLQATFIVGVAAAVGALSFVPNGAGVTEISNTAMLLALVAPNNPIMFPVVAASAALIQSFFHKWFRVLVGLVFMVLFRRRLFSEEFDQMLAEWEISRQSNTEQAVAGINTKRA